MYIIEKCVITHLITYLCNSSQYIQRQTLYELKIQSFGVLSRETERELRKQSFYTFLGATIACNSVKCNGKALRHKY